MKKIVITLTILVLFQLIWILITFAGEFEGRNWVTVIANNLILFGSIFSIYHITSRAESYEKKAPFRRYLHSMRLFFIPMIIFGFYLIWDELLKIQGTQSITNLIDNLHEDIIFNIYGKPEWKVSMPVSSIFIFGILQIAIISFMYPIETLIRQEKRPIHTILQILIILLLPLLFIDAMVNINWFVSTMLLISVLIILMNFLYLFWTYFSVAIKSPKGPVRNGGFMIAFSLIMIILAWMASWIFASVEDAVKFGITYGIAFGSILMLNLGFYTLRPIQ